MTENSAWKSLNRARNLLGVAYLAAKGIDVDPCRGLAEQFATLIGIIQDGVDNAMMAIAAGKKAAGAEVQPIERRPAA
jgi:hypothetical protein